MGNYNPNVPQIIGQEWVPIRDEPLILNPFANTVERGYTFNLPTATRINNVRFYLKDWTEFFGSSMIYTASIYPQGQEASSGPVRSVIIPVSAASATGSGSQLFAISADFPYNIISPSDNAFIYWVMGQGATAPIGYTTYFAVNSYQPLLYGNAARLEIGENTPSGTRVGVSIPR